MNDTWAKHCRGVADYVAISSHDPSTKVGAVLTRPNKRILATGFNQFPPGHSNDPALWADREYKYNHVIHAEEIALAQAKRYFKANLIAGCTMVTNFPVCPECMEKLGLEGIVEVIQPALEATKGFDKRSPEWIAFWKDNIEQAAIMAQCWRIKVVTYG